MTLTIRDASPLDAGRVADILHRFNCDTSWIPDLHTAAEALSFCGVMIDRGWVRVAVEAECIVGFCARDGEHICALYVSHTHRRRGIGGALLDNAKRSVNALDLWTFEQNAPARGFYERNGFLCTRTGDGSGNDEGLPDVYYQWAAEPESAKVCKP